MKVFSTAMIAAVIGGAAGYAAGGMQVATGPSYDITTRKDLQNITVPVLRPSSEDHVIALDIMPRGRPKEWAGHGFSWLHLCDGDVIARPDGPLSCAQVSVTSKDIRIGSSFYNGGAAKPVSIISGRDVIGQFTPGRLVVGEFDTIDLLKRIDALESRLKDIEAGQ